MIPVGLVGRDKRGARYVQTAPLPKEPFRHECPTCHGAGKRIGWLWRLLGRAPVTCETCKGRGTVFRVAPQRRTF